jgi:hypothetical protein
MGYLEAVVVVYLRAAVGVALAGTPAQVSVDITPFVGIEVVRELSTVVMIAAVGWLAGRAGWERLAWSAVVFGAWDIVYYLGLYLAGGWPPSLDTWDVLFLVPVAWVGPVWAPVAVSMALIVGGLAAASRLRHGHPIRPRGWEIAGAVLGGMLVIVSFVIEAQRVLAGDLSPWNGWPLLLGGIALGALCAGSAIYGRAQGSKG